MSGILNLLLAGAASVVKDAYFNLVTLLLNTTSTNGAQNNTFLDSSTNNFSITRNGNATQGTFTPFSQTGWGNYFDGSADGFSYSGTTFGSGAWTVELFFYFTGTSFTGPIQLFEGTTNSLVLALMSSTTIRVDQVNVSNDLYTVPTMSANTWYHLAATKDASGNQTLFLNGVRSSTGVTTTSRNFSSATLRIAYSTIGGTDFTGYYSNLRFVTGTAVYNPLSSTITVPTAPLTAISGTQLLTCQSNRFIDNSANNFALTVNGTPSVQAFSPFAPTTAYDTAVVGGSGYFDGSGDYLTAANNAAFNLPADFTIECWWYPMDLSGSSNLFCIGDSRASYNGLLLYWSTGAGKLILYSNGANVVVSSLSTPINTWYHLAAVRSGSTVTFYINGASVGTATNTTTFTGLAGNGFAVGAEYYGPFDSSRKMYLTGLRLVKGTAVYTSNFTPPTAPPTAITNTQLLLNYTNAGIYDSAAKNDLETVGNAQVSTTQAKFGTTSMYFDGTGDNLKSKLTNAIGGGDYTIEMWLYTGASGARYIFDMRETSQFLGAFTVGTTLYVNIGTTLDIVATTSYTQNAWVHFAIVRSGSGSNNTSVFLNGSRILQVTDSTNYSIIPTLYIGNDNTSSYSWDGYIDEFRITKGYARYSGSTYTVPAAAFPIQ